MVQEAAKLGFKEISLAGDDMGCYGIDINSSLAELLTQILAVSSDFVINIRFVEPFWLIKGLSDLYPLFKTGRVKSFCVPLQSGSQSVLDRMNRNYDINEAVNAVNYVIDKTNVNSISSIVMAGFPGETSEDFEKTLDLLNICRANLYQVLKYEERPGTPSADMSGKIDEKTKDVRVKAFTKKMKRLKFANLSEFIWRSK
jgi:threonylcarbamoyladenosine tRNA methylthiotransferase MtaB